MAQAMQHHGIFSIGSKLKGKPVGTSVEGWLKGRVENTKVVGVPPYSRNVAQGNFIVNFGGETSMLCKELKIEKPMIDFMIAGHDVSVVFTATVAEFATKSDDKSDSETYLGVMYEFATPVKVDDAKLLDKPSAE